MGKYLKHIAVVLLLLLLGTYSCELEKVNDCPSITSIKPLIARVGETIVLEGKFVNYGKYEGDKVLISNKKVTTSDASNNRIVAKIPENIDISDLSVVVIIDGCNSNSIGGKNDSIIYKKVTVTDINIVKAKHSQQIKISGTNFRIDSIAANKVSFNGTEAEVILATATELTVVVPEGAKSGAITVEVDGFKASSTENFTYEFTATVSLLAGKFSPLGGAIDGFGSDAQFDTPTGIDVFTSSAGQTTIFVADTKNHVIRKITPKGEVSLFAGTFGTAGSFNPDSSALPATFNNPVDVAADEGGNVFVTESGNHTIRKILPSGKIVQPIAGAPPPAFPGFADGLGSLARFQSPHGITVGDDSLLYISDKIDHRIRKIDTKNKRVTVSTFAGDGNFDWIDGVGTSTSFDSPRGLSYNFTNKTMYVADFENNKIRSIFTPEANVITIAEFSDDREFSNPNDLAMDIEGNIYVADSGNQIKRIDGRTHDVTFIAGVNVPGLGGLGEDPQLENPSGIAYDGLHNIIYIADTGNNVIRQIVLK